MSDRTIQQVIAFNQELAALSAAGVPLDLRTGEQSEMNRPDRIEDTSSTSVVSMLDRVNASLSMRVGNGQSLEQAVREEPLLTSNYRKALLAFLRCDDPRLALDMLSAPASSKQRFALGVGSAMVYPLIVLTVAYFGFLYLCQVTGPKIEAMYEQVGQQPSAATMFLSNSRHWIPVWGPLVPLLIAGSLIWWHLRGARMSWNWLPGSQGYYRAVQNAQVANQLAGMLDNGCDLEESLETVIPESSRGTQLPPLLRWAIESDTGDEPLSKILRFVALTYQQTANRQERLWRVMLPMLCGLALGGILVLGYGLSLFLPVVQLLRDVARSGMGGI